MYIVLVILGVTNLFVNCDLPPCPGKACPRIIDPVCGVRANGEEKEFLNECLFEAANCHNGRNYIREKSTKFKKKSLLSEYPNSYPGKCHPKVK